MSELPVDGGARPGGGRILAKVAVWCMATVVVAVVAAEWAASRTENERQALATLIRTGQLPKTTAKLDPRREVDPVTTGSVIRRADQTRLDPCEIRK